MNVFVTGASGFVGGGLVRALRARLAPADRLFLLSRRAGRADEPGTTWLAGSLEDLGRHEEALLSADYVYHLAAEARLSGRDFFRVNAEGTAALVSLLGKSRRLKALVLVSSIMAVDRLRGDRCALPLSPGSPPCPGTAYGRSKLQAEEAVRAGGLPFVIVRPPFVYGRGMSPDSHLNRLTTLVRRGNPFARFDFPGRVSLIHVDDLAAALANVIGNAAALGRTYIAATESAALGAILRLIHLKLTGEKLKQIPVPRPPGLLCPVLPAKLKWLLYDFLVGSDPAFRRDLLGGLRPRPLDTGIEDVIATNGD